MFRDRSDDYRKARVEPAIELPEHIDSDTIGDSYAIPPIADRTTLDETFEIPTPDRLADDINRDSVRINTLGAQRWILVDGAPGQVWPRLRGFLSLNQLSVQRVDATSGIIETSWLQPQGEDLLQERYQLRIEQGVQRGTSEVYILQADMRSGTDSWPELSSSDERELIMTQELGQYLADSAAAAAVSMLAEQAIDSSGRVTLEEDENANVYINLHLAFDRAWASIGRALEKAGYLVEDLNREQQVYYVQYSLERDKDSEGFFSSLFSWGDDELAPGEGTPYLIKVHTGDDNTVTITIELQNGEAMAKSETEQLLKRLKRYIV